MSNPATAAHFTSFSEWLSHQREQRGGVLRDLAAQCGLDLTLLSRFENGQRLPTEEQADSLARFYAADANEVHALRIADQFRRKYAGHPAAHDAIQRLAEGEGIYRVKARGKRKEA